MPSGGTDVHTPQPTAQELEIQSEQLRALRLQNRTIEQIMPELMRSMGYRLEMVDDQPIITKMTDEEYLASMSETERMAYENYKLGLERQHSALKGELPLSEATKREKEKEWEIFKESQARQGNIITGDIPEEGTAEADAGIRSIQAFNEYWGMREDAERRGEISGGVQNILGMSGLMSEEQRLAYSELAGSPAIWSSAPYGAVLQPYQYYANLTTQGEIAESQIAMQEKLKWMDMLNSAGNTAGGMGGMAMFGSMMSSKDFKENIEKVDDKDILDMVKKGNTYVYNYKGDNPENKKIGIMAEEAPPMITDGKMINVQNYLGFLNAGIRELAKKVDKIEKRRKK